MFYVRDRSQSLDIRVDVVQFDDLNRTNYNATLDVVGDPADTLILASEADEVGLFHEITRQRFPDVNWAYVIPTDSQVGRSSPTNPNALALFNIPADFVAENRGTFEARLPSIASGETGRQDSPAYGVIGAQSQHITVTKVPQAPVRFTDKVSTSPYDYGIPDPKDETLYWEPKSINVSVHLSDESSRIDDSRIDQNSPSSGTVQEPDIVWTGGFGVSPYIIATKYSAIERRSRYEFYSGIALGLGGAALVALVQELPAELPRRRRRGTARKRPEKMPSTSRPPDAHPGLSNTVTPEHSLLPASKKPPMKASPLPARQRRGRKGKK